MGSLRELIIQQLGQKSAIDAGAIDDETLLFSSGLVDSFTLVELLSALESASGIRVAPVDVNLENFDSISRILAYASRQSVS